MDKEAFANVIPLKGGKCPICDNPGIQKFRPFCSKRCADRDLGHWFNEDYRIASEEGGELDDDAYPDE